MDSSLEATVLLCRGVSYLQRWTGVEILKQTTFQVAVQIIAYNMLMNGVDRMGQLCSKNITQHRKKRLYMAMFTMCLDLAIHQAYCMYMALHPVKQNRKHKTLLSFKGKVATFLIGLEMRRKTTKKANLVVSLPNARQTALNINETLGRIEEGRMVVRNLGKKKFPDSSQDAPCYLHKLRGFMSRTIYGCPSCKAVFHVECFTAFHYKYALKGNKKDLIDMLKAFELAGKNHKKKSKYVGSIDSLPLPPKPIQRYRKKQPNSHNDNNYSSDNTSSDTSENTS
jgi:hypothetical protein